MMMKRHIAIVDPGVRDAEVQSFNNMVELSALPLTYHLPCMAGPQSLGNESQDSLAGVVILGSASSVNDKLPWQLALNDWLLPLMKSGVPTFGVCYGHQLFAHLLGGKVDFIGAGIRHRGFREIEFDSNPLWGNQKFKGSFFVTHKEWVTHVPNELVCVGRSKDVPNDAFAHKTLPIWSIQAHPEALDDFAGREGTPVTDLNRFKPGHNLLRQFFAFCAGNKN